MDLQFSWTKLSLAKVQKKKEKKKVNKYNIDLRVNLNFDPQRFNLISSIGVEVQEPEELRKKLASGRLLRAYDGFQPSGRMHIAQGILRAINVNKLVDAGCVFIFWVADWFAMLNNKFEGDLQKIKIVGKYFIEIWKAAGMKMQNVQFLWASEEINKRPNDYWLQVMDIARKNTITRIRKCATALGKKEGDDLSVAQLFYPCMQCTDIFFLDVDICQLGLDQRKVNMLARDYCEGEKPVIVSHGMMMGLLEGQAKMSKSDPNSAIFMEDSEEDVRKKIKQAFCPQKILQENPIIDYCRLIVLPALGSLPVPRTPANGGNVTYTSFQHLSKDFSQGLLHPNDLKPAVSAALNALIQPVRQHFQKDPEARALLQTIKSFYQ